MIEKFACAGGKVWSEFLELKSHWQSYNSGVPYDCEVRSGPWD